MNDFTKRIQKLKKKWNIYRRRKLKKHLKLAAKGCVAGGLFGILLIISIFIFYSFDLPTASELENAQFAESTKILDRNKELLYEVHGNEQRTFVSLDQISQNLINATVALEDDEFYTHPGYDIKALTRVGACIIQTGFRKVIPFVPYCRLTGGSTITQQFIKNTYITNEPTLARKVKELLLSRKIEKTYTKEQILEMYVNRIPYGGTLYGIEAASQSYFEKPASELTIMESALLASIPKKPTALSPHIGDREKLLFRAEYALDRMEFLEMITPEEKETALEEEIVYSKPTIDFEAGHFVIYAKSELQKLLEQIYSEERATELIETEGLEVITTLDFELQKLAEKAVIENMEKADENNYDAENASLVAQDPRTGEILAMVGSRDFFAEDFDGQVNVATSFRQPGSSIKPLVYTSAFTKGYSPGTIVYDVKTNFGSGYSPNNYNYKFAGPVSLRKSLAQSLNIPAVKALYLAGISDTIKLGNKLGITNWTTEDGDRCGLSLVLGGCEVRLIDMVQLYSVFANIGDLPDQHIFLKITDKNGDIIYEHKQEKPKNVLDPKVAYLAHSVLSDNENRAPSFGTNNKLNLPRENGAKTGTTNQYLDAWTIGYVPQLVAGVWAGNNQPSPMKHGGSVIAAPIWHQFMTDALKLDSYKTILPFPKPEGLTTASVSSLSGLLPSGNTPPNRIEEDLFIPQNIPSEIEPLDRVARTTICTSSGLIATELCPEEFQEILVYEKHKSILDTNNPAHTRWQNAVDGWVIKQQENPPESPEDVFEGIIPVRYVYNLSEIPTELDFTFSEENLLNAPELSWIDEPSANLEFGDTELSFIVQGLEDIKKLSILIDGKTIEQFEKLDNRETITFNLPLSEDSFEVNSQHSIFVLAYDNADRQGYLKHNFTIKADAFPPNVKIISPEEKNTISTQFVSLEAHVSDSNSIKRVEFFIDGKAVKVFEEATENNRYQITLEGVSFPPAGKHVFKVRAYDEYDNFTLVEQNLQIR